MNAGSVFRFADSSIDDHPWIVLSDPARDARRVLVVSITTWHQGVADSSCIVEPGEHPAISSRSCIYYDSAMIVSLEQLRSLAAAAEVVVQPSPLSAELLARARRGAAQTVFLTFDQLALLDDQGLLPE